MKKLVNGIIASVMIAAAAMGTGCQKESESALGSLTVKVGVSEIFEGIDLSGISVKIVNTSDNSTLTAETQANGVALFNEISPAVYNVSASLELPAEEAVNYTGTNQAVTLNGVATDVTLLPSGNQTVELVLDGKAGGSLVIKEIYTLGATKDNYAIMFKDQFIEIYNNSDEIQYVDGLYLADLGPSADGSDPDKTAPLGLPLDEYVYAAKVLQFPGNGTDYPVEPGKSIVMAMNAVNYKADKPDAVTVDNSTADFDTYAIDWLQEQGRTGNSFFDVDNPQVPTMKCIYLNIENSGWFNFASYGSVALFKLDSAPTETVLDPTSLSTQIYYLKMPVSGIIDGVDNLAATDAGAFKRLPSSVDAGFFCPKGYSGDNAAITGLNYSGNSIRRKVAKVLPDGRNVLSDTNNSANDFEVVEAPTPRCYDLN